MRKHFKSVGGEGGNAIFFRGTMEHMQVPTVEGPH